MLYLWLIGMVVYGVYCYRKANPSNEEIERGNRALLNRCDHLINNARSVQQQREEAQLDSYRAELKAISDGIVYKDLDHLNHLLKTGQISESEFERRASALVEQLPPSRNTK
ncbi:hypothetical protein [Tellurirhabdus bombi]|uniref:hypothetical protein n=1 Tax=Tellurirhabdus bombi TaxID=2907205 RepID=UPI001F1ADA04|nr:hypothetical protein [Tellurirhabdus bombi]